MALKGQLEENDAIAEISAYVLLEEAVLVIRFNPDGVTSMLISEDVQELCLEPNIYSLDPNIPNGTPGQVSFC